MQLTTIPIANPIIQVEVPQVERLMEQLEELSITCSHVLSYTSAAKCYAGLVNKRPAGQFSRLTQAHEAGGTRPHKMSDSAFTLDTRLTVS